MSLKSLIQNQELKIDSHKRGEAISDELEAVHIHKRFYEGRRRKKAVKISIKGDSIEFDKNIDDEERRSIVNEIKRVLDKDRQKLINFAKYIAENLYKWSQKRIKIEEAEKYASGIAEIFGLKTEASKTLIKKVGESLVQYKSIHADQSGQLYTINQKSSGIIIRPGNSI